MPDLRQGCTTGKPSEDTALLKERCANGRMRQTKVISVHLGKRYATGIDVATRTKTRIDRATGLNTLMKIRR
jgi:hypothetical protein